ncbi:MAG: carboxypeptidase regulatory-like domain-containing protein [Archangiaceae bacterium]|nr:carboxypeptidase regulatory-like domain-containing protein [Archangiaceae bacterium]
MKRAVLGVLTAVLGATLLVYLSTRDDRTEPGKAAAPRSLLTEPVGASAGRSHLSGRVLAHGQPVAGATVTATVSDPTRSIPDTWCSDIPNCTGDALFAGKLVPSEVLERPIREQRGAAAPVARTVSAADGSFNLSGLGAGTVWLWADDPQRGTAMVRDVAVDSTGVELEFERSTPLFGRVMLPSGQPARGAWVAVIALDADRYFGTVTDGEGRFRFSALPRLDVIAVPGSPGFLTLLNRLPGRFRIELQLPLIKPHALSGVVVESGRPVEGATVALEHRGEVRQLTTGADGTFEFGELTEGRYRLLATRGERRAGHDVTVRGDDDLAPVTLALEAAAYVTGHVRSRSGEPIARATVTAADDDAHVSCVTGADGAYQLLAAAGPARHLTVTAEGFGADARELELVDGAQVVDFELEPQVMLQGRVLDAETGRPLGGALITAHPLSRAGEDLDAEAGDDGAFALDGAASGEYELLGTADGFAATRLPVTAPTARAELRLTRGQRIRGVVVSADGAPAQATVSAHRTRGRERHPSVDTDATGAFELTGFTDGDFTVSAAHGELTGTLEVRLPLPPTSQVRVVLSAPLSIAGVVVDAVGKPVAGVRVSARPVDGRGEGTDGLGEQPTDVTGRFAVTVKAPGEYELGAHSNTDRALESADLTARAGDTQVRLVIRRRPVARGRVVDARHQPITEFVLGGYENEIPSGTFATPLDEEDTELELEVSGYLPRRVALPPRAPGRDVDLGDIVAGEGRAVRFLVLSRRSGKPLAGASVHTFDDWSHGDGPPSLCITGTDGVATLRGVPQTAFAVEVAHDAHVAQRVDLAAGDTQKTVTLERGASLRVSVLDAARRPAQAMVTVLPLGEVAPSKGEDTDSSGWARFEGLSAGSYLVLAERRGDGERQRVTGEVTVPASGEARLQLQLRQGSGRVLLQLSPGAWELDTVVLYPEGPLPTDARGPRYALLMRIGQRAEETDAPNQFELFGVAPGTWRVVVEAYREEQAGYWSWGPLQVTGEREQRVVVPPITQVTLADESPRPGSESITP